MTNGTNKIRAGFAGRAQPTTVSGTDYTRLPALDSIETRRRQFPALFKILDALDTTHGTYDIKWGLSENASKLGIMVENTQVTEDTACLQLDFSSTPAVRITKNPKCAAFRFGKETDPIPFSKLQDMLNASIMDMRARRADISAPITNDAMAAHKLVEAFESILPGYAFPARCKVTGPKQAAG